MKIRSWQRTDTAVLNHLHQAINPSQPFPSTRHLWLLEEAGQMVGYTAVSLVPGLAGTYELNGGILPEKRRQGLGSHLLHHTLNQARTLHIRQLSHCASDQDSPAGHFLRHHHFFVEHEEWLMRLPSLQTRQLADPLLTTCQLVTRHSPTFLFRLLYDQSFSGMPWYQPYSQEEVEDTLEAPDDILFLFKDDQPIGFAWLQGEAQEAVIEPIGIVKEEWGKGYGRNLLLAALNELKQRGAEQAQIGVWCSNQVAVHLYQGVGFQHRQTLTYLALNIASHQHPTAKQ